MASWHDAGCRKPDLVWVNDMESCLSCGSIREAPGTPDIQPPLPAAGTLTNQPMKQSSELRILELEPGECDEPLRGRLRIEEIGKFPDYHTISYTWADERGDTDKNSAIHLDGAVLAITRNCHTALRRVRRQVSAIRLWIDAVCIDQDNISERGHQVNLMPKVYARARSVYVYLGESSDGSDAVIGFLGGDQRSFSAATRAGFQKLVRRRYFSRIWVLQEIALARTAVLICGDRSVPFDKLKSQNVRALLSLKRGGDAADLPSVLRVSSPSVGDHDAWLDALDMGRLCDAADPHDKVYALFGLVAPAAIAPLTADYHLPVDALYTAVARAIIRNHGLGAALIRAGTANSSDSSRHQQVAVPSWVPDWRYRFPTFSGKVRDEITKSFKTLAPLIPSPPGENAITLLGFPILRLPDASGIFGVCRLFKISNLPGPGRKPFYDDRDLPISGGGGGRPGAGGGAAGGRDCISLRLTDEILCIVFKYALVLELDPQTTSSQASWPGIRAQSSLFTTNTLQWLSQLDIPDLHLQTSGSFRLKTVCDLHDYAFQSSGISCEEEASPLQPSAASGCKHYKLKISFQCCKRPLAGHEDSSATQQIEDVQEISCFGLV